MEHTPSIKHPIPNAGVGWSAIGEEEIAAVTAVLRTPQFMFRYRGKEDTQCSLLEKELCAVTGMRHALFVASGTSALTCALSALSIGPGDEVIVPAYTYIATAAAVIEVGAVPVIAEIDESLGMSPEDAESKITPRTKALLVVHMQGVPCRLDELRALAARRGIRVIEDACQAVGAQYRGSHVGAHSDACAWSLNYYKVLTCGEGGVFFARDDTDFTRGVYYSDPGTPMWDSNIEGVGQLPPFAKGGCRGNELLASIARVQLGKLSAILGTTRALKRELLARLAPGRHYRLQHVDDPEGDCGISCAFIVESAETAARFAEALSAEGLSIGSAYNQGFPDRHIYSYWEGIMNKTGATPKGYPWKDPSYTGDVRYSRDMCPRTLDLLARTLRLAINIKMDAVNMREIADAINYVDASL